MAFLAPAAAGAVSATAGATALAKGAAIASSASGALGTGLAAGTALGGGAMASMPALSYAGANLAAPGILGALPSAIAPTAGIFAKAAPALGGLSSFAPAAPGVFSQAAPALGGLSSLATPTASSLSSAALQTAKGNIIQNAMANQAAQTAMAQNVAGGQVAQNLAAPLAQTGASPATLTSRFGLDTAGVRPGLKMPTELYGGQVTPDMAFKTMGEGASGVLPQTTQATQLATKAASPIQADANFATNFMNLVKNPSLKGAAEYAEKHPFATMAGVQGLYSAMQPKYRPPEQDKGMIRPYTYTRTQRPEAYAVSPATDSSEQLYFDEHYTPGEPRKAAEGGIMGLAVGGPIETMSAMNSVGANMMYPQAQLQTPLYSNPMVQRPEAVNVIAPSSGAAVGAYTGEQRFAEGGEPKTEGVYKYDFDPRTNTFTQLSAPRYADVQPRGTGATDTLPPLYTGAKTAGGIAPPVGGPGVAALLPQAQPAYTGPVVSPYQTPEQQLGLTEFYAMMNRRLGQMGRYATGGGISDLGGYSDGGRLLKGPGDGVSDSIPAVIGERQPARLADGEFVVPARIVSELGNGSTEAGARKLYAMMDRVQKARRKTVGKDRVAANTKAEKYLPA